MPGWGIDWFFVATKACGGGSFDLGLFLMVSLFIGFFGVGFTRRWASRVPPPTRARQGDGVPWCPVGSWGPTSGGSLLHYFSFLPKKS